ncbi:RNA-directed DNA polymerase, eukaryota, reverse transcriptase zinc-binding domain protein [Tanacetum coccineum]
MTCVRWENVLASRDQGGLGIGSLKAFNLALLQKWRWRFTINPNLLWVKLIKAIHGYEASFDGKGCATSGIWSTIVGSTNYLHSHNLLPKDLLKCLPGNGTSIGFWKDLWLGEEPLCRTQSMFQSLQVELAYVNLSSTQDSWKWHIGSDGSFTVASTRTHSDLSMLPSWASSTAWIKCLPRKINIFLWRFNLDRLPHRLNLSKHSLDIDSIICPVCNINVESAEHVFFSYEMAAQVWRLIRIWCNISDSAMPSYLNWSSWIDAIPRPQIKKKKLFVIIVCMLWTIWKYRNDVTFNS